VIRKFLVKMKVVKVFIFLFLVANAFCSITGIYSARYVGSDGWDIEYLNTRGRLYASFLSIFLLVWYVGIIKKKIYAWWLGIAWMYLVILSLFLYILYLVKENEKYTIWNIVVSIFVAIVFIIFFRKFWIYQKRVYFSNH